MADAPLLAIDNLDAFYGSFQALFGVSLRIEKGETIAIIGAIRYMNANDSPPLVYHRGAFGGLSARKLGHTPVPEFW